MVQSVQFSLHKMKYPKSALIIVFLFPGGADAMLMAPAVILLGKYFKKRRGLANGIAFAHISLGSLVLPNFFRYIVEEYGLQGAFILTAGLTMNMLVAASLFRPLSFYSKRCSKNDSNDVVKIGENCDEDCDKDLKHTDYNDTFPKNKNLDLSMQLLPIRNTERFKSHSSEFINHDREPNKLFPSMRSLCAIEVHFSGSVTSLAREPEELQESPLTLNNSEVNTNKSKSLGNRCKNFSFLRNFHVLQNRQFLIFSFVIASGSIATVNIFTFIPHHAEQRGVDKTRAALLVSIMSGTDFFGRLLCGYLADRHFIKRTTIILISQIIICVLLFSAQLYSQFWGLVLFCACSGFFLGMITTLMAPITVDILGIDAFGAGMTVILVMMSISHGASMVIMGKYFSYICLKYIPYSLVYGVYVPVFVFIPHRRVCSYAYKRGFYTANKTC